MASDSVRLGSVLTVGWMGEAAIGGKVRVSSQLGTRVFRLG
jgi:hypothetical protein